MRSMTWLASTLSVSPYAQKSVMVAHTKSADEFWRELTILTTLDCPRAGFCRPPIPNVSHI